MTDAQRGAGPPAEQDEWATLTGGVAPALPLVPDSLGPDASPPSATAPNGTRKPVGPPAAAPPELSNHPRYHVVRQLGQGGMGTVYEADHRVMKRAVALKVISAQFVADPAAVARFRREVEAAAALSHPNIVTAHDAEQAGDCHFLVMELVDGVSLDRLVQKKGP